MLSLRYLALSGAPSSMSAEDVLALQGDPAARSAAGTQLRFLVGIVNEGAYISEASRS